MVMKKIMFTMTVTYDEDETQSDYILSLINHEMLSMKGVLFTESDVIFDKQIKQKAETK